MGGAIGRASTLRCGRVWCAAGLVSAEAVVESSLLMTSAVACLAECLAVADDSSATDAADTVCAALGAAHEDVRVRNEPTLDSLQTGLCMALRERLAHIPISRHTAAIACEACMVLAVGLSIAPAAAV